MAFQFIDHETWRFINTFAPWLSAIGTLAAVIFSLYITLADRARLNVRAWKHGRQPAYSAEDSELIPMISIRITNSRDKEVFVDEVYWKMGDSSSRQVINYTLASNLDLDGPSMLVGKVPTQIDFYCSTFKERYLPRLAQSLRESQGRVKIGVMTSTGKRFESVVERDLETWFREAAKEIADHPSAEELE